LYFNVFKTAQIDCYTFSYNKHYDKLMSVLHTALCKVVDVEHWQLGCGPETGEC